MGNLTLLRVARWARRSSNPPEYPHLEALVEQESVKMTDGFHYARWIVPLVGLFLSLACFLPLALYVHPLFWIGCLGAVVLGAVLGGIFHVLASRISQTQLLLRKRCIGLAGRLIGFGNLVGMAPTLSPRIAEILDEAARAYLAAGQYQDRGQRIQPSGLWAEAAQNAERAMDEAMAQMLLLAEPESPQAQEVELSRGWAQPLLQEMRATVETLEQSSRTAAAQIGAIASPLADLADARAHLERLGSAAAELGQEPSTEQLNRRN